MTYQVVLVEDPEIPRLTPYPLGLFFNRSAATTPAPPLALVTQKAPLWELYRDTFTSVYSVVEVFGQQTQTFPSGNPTIFFPKAGRLDPPEEDLRRFDHQLYFQVARHYTAQLIGHTFEIPDFNDHPWLEWVHPPANPESALFPYRRQPVVTPPSPFVILWGQPKPWPVTAEEDSVFRHPDVGVLIPYGRPIPPTITMPNLIGLDQQTAIGIILADGLIYLGSVFQDEIYYPQQPPTPWNPIGPTPPDKRGTVIGQWPLPGTTVQPLLTQVTLILSSGFNFIPGTDTSSNNNPNTYQGSTQFP